MSKTCEVYTLEEKVKLIKACKIKVNLKCLHSFLLHRAHSRFQKNKYKLLKQYENSATAILIKTDTARVKRLTLKRRSIFGLMRNICKELYYPL